MSKKSETLSFGLAAILGISIGTTEASTTDTSKPNKQDAIEFCEFVTSYSMEDCTDLYEKMDAQRDQEKNNQSKKRFFKLENRPTTGG